LNGTPIPSYPIINPPLYAAYIHNYIGYVETTSNKKQWPYGARKENKKAADIHAKTGRQIRVAMEATLEKSRYRERKRSLPVFP